MTSALAMVRLLWVIDKLRDLHEFLEHPAVAVDVRLIQGRVNLIQDAERSGFDFEYREDQGYRRRPFPPRARARFEVFPGPGR
jgi:hypothetical protein